MAGRQEGEIGGICEISSRGYPWGLAHFKNIWYCKWWISSKTDFWSDLYYRQASKTQRNIEILIRTCWKSKNDPRVFSSILSYVMFFCRIRIWYQKSRSLSFWWLPIFSFYNFLNCFLQSPFQIDFDHYAREALKESLSIVRTLVLSLQPPLRIIEPWWCRRRRPTQWFWRCPCSSACEQCFI